MSLFLHRRALDSSSCPCNCNGALHWSLLSSLHVVIFVCVSEPTVIFFYIRPPDFPFPSFPLVWTRKGFSNLLQFGDCETPGLFMRQSGPPLSPNYSITSSNPLSQKLSPIHSHNANIDGACSCIFLIAVSITSFTPLSHKLLPIHRHNANLDGACSYVFFLAVFLFYSILTLVCYLVLPQVVSNNIILSI